MAQRYSGIPGGPESRIPDAGADQNLENEQQQTQPYTYTMMTSPQILVPTIMVPPVIIPTPVLQGSILQEQYHSLRYHDFTSLTVAAENSFAYRGFQSYDGRGTVNVGGSALQPYSSDRQLQLPSIGQIVDEATAPNARIVVMPSYSNIVPFPYPSSLLDIGQLNDAASNPYASNTGNALLSTVGSSSAVLDSANPGRILSPGLLNAGHPVSVPRFQTPEEQASLRREFTRLEVLPDSSPTRQCRLTVSRNQRRLQSSKSSDGPPQNSISRLTAVRTWLLESDDIASEITEVAKSEKNVDSDPANGKSPNVMDCDLVSAEVASTGAENVEPSEKSNSTQFRRKKKKGEIWNISADDKFWSTVKQCPPPDDSTCSKIAQKAEHYLSDEYLKEHPDILDQVQLKGYISGRSLRSYGELQMLASDWSVLRSAIVRKSKQLLVYDERVRRIQRLPVELRKSERLLSAVIGISLPSVYVNENLVGKLFGIFGKLRSIQYYRPGHASSPHLGAYSYLIPDLGSTMCCVGRFEKAECASTTVRMLNKNTRTSSIQDGSETDSTLSKESHIFKSIGEMPDLGNARFARLQPRILGILYPEDDLLESPSDLENLEGDPDSQTSSSASGN